MFQRQKLVQLFFSFFPWECSHIIPFFLFSFFLTMELHQYLQSVKHLFLARSVVELLSHEENYVFSSPAAFCVMGGGKNNLFSEFPLDHIGLSPSGFIGPPRLLHPYRMSVWSNVFVCFSRLTITPLPAHFSFR